MKSKIKKVLIIGILILAIIGIVLFILIIKQNKSLQTPYVKEEEPSVEFIIHNNVEEPTEYEEFFYAIECIKTYINKFKMINIYSYDNEIEEDVKQKVINNTKEEILALIDKKYIEENSLSINNIDTKFSKYYSNIYFETKNMYIIDFKDKHESVYYVYGILINEDNHTQEEYGFIVRIDTSDLLFSIYPYDYIVKNNLYDTNINKENSKNIIVNEIEQNDYNKFRGRAFDYQYISKYYFDIYKENLIYNLEEVYNSLNNEYAEKRFESFKEFKKYIEENYNELITSYVSEYTVENYDNKRIYICKDQYDRIYLFEENKIGNYTLQLDSYTLDNEKTKLVYESGTNKDKVALNIDKFFVMLNTNDYRSAYKMLNQNFKNLNFKTEQSFENYMRQNIYTHADVSYVKFSDEISGVFTYYIELKDKTNTNNKVIKMNIVMQLLEGTDYSLSFEIL